MTPQEKFKELIEIYDYAYIIKIIDHMTLYYVGIGVEQLREFWLLVGIEAEQYNLNKS